MKKIVALLLALVMALSVVACAESGDKKNGKKKGNAKAGDGFYLEVEDSVELGTPEKKLDPKEVYSKLTYTPEMFYGNYQLEGGEEAEQKFGEETSYKTIPLKDKFSEEDKEWTVLPFGIKAGSGNLAHIITSIKEYNWMQAYYMKKDSNGKFNLDYTFFAYTVEGNKLTMTPLAEYNYIEAEKKIEYALSDVKLEYEFKFEGRHLTLTTGDESVTLLAGLDAYAEYNYLHVENYLSLDSKRLDNIEEISFRYDAEEADSWIYFETEDGECCYSAVGLLEENGLFTFTVPLEAGTKTYQLVYFLCDENGIILTDGDNVYYYTVGWRDKNTESLSEYISEDQTGKLDSLTESQLEAVVEKKENLMEDLAKAFDEAGIKVTVDEKTGELAMDSSILFGGDSAVLTDEGKEFLNKFVKAYTSIVFSEKYDGFVSKTMVEGHTAPVAGSTYESGLPLSEERANNVKNYCVSSETGLDVLKLASALEAVGYSNSKPVLDANGNVDMAASRRVSFRFIINLEQN